MSLLESVILAIIEGLTDSCRYPPRVHHHRLVIDGVAAVHKVFTVAIQLGAIP